MAAALKDYGIDYITLTTPRSGVPETLELEFIKGLLLREYFDGQAGMDVQKWGWNGYVGWQYGPLSWGSRPGGSILRLSGGAARLVTAMHLGGDWRATRIDLQVTIDLGGRGVDDHIRDMRGEALAERAGKQGRPYKVAFIDGCGDGNTLYIGSRSSQVFCRVYNKGAEDGFEDDTIGCVRYEVECKAEAAERLWGELRDASNAPTMGAGLVAATYNARGLRLPSTVLNTADAPIRAIIKQTDLEGRLLWLEKAVGGVVRKLITAGYGDDVLRALSVEVDGRSLTCAAIAGRVGGRDLV